jgi:hypothetical protein
MISSGRSPAIEGLCANPARFPALAQLATSLNISRFCGSVPTA